MRKLNAETLETLRNIRTEIVAGMLLFPKTAQEKAYNMACERAKSIVWNYMEGHGLFQMVTEAEARAAERAAQPDYGVPDAEAAGQAEYDRVTREGEE